MSQPGTVCELCALCVPNQSLSHTFVIEWVPSGTSAPGVKNLIDDTQMGAWSMCRGLVTLLGMDHV